MEKTLRNLSRATVTGVCSTRNLDLVRSIGADFVVDYTGEDFTHNGRRYDLIFDTVVKHTFSECKSALGPQGNYITTEFSPVLALRGLWTSITGDTRMVPLPARAPSKEDLVFINKLLYDGKVTPVIDSCYSLSEVPDALCYLEKDTPEEKSLFLSRGISQCFQRSIGADQQIASRFVLHLTHLVVVQVCN